MRVTKLMLLAALVALLMSSGPWVNKSIARTKGVNDTTKRLNAAADVLREVMATPEATEGAFIIGAKYGRGFILCRNKDGRGWSAPGGVKVEGGSVGFQIGGSETDVVMLLMNQGAIDKLLSSKFTIGGDASVAAGPVGRTSSAKTDAQLHAELLSYSRARGLFAGVSLDGATMRPDDDANKDMYGRKMSNQEVVLGNVKPPRTAARLIAELNRHSSRRAGG